MNRVAIVTGAVRGIGKAVAKTLLARGYAVVVADVSAETWTADADAAELHFFRTDVSREAEVTKLVATTLDRFARLDLLVNNAAISADEPVETLDLDTWRRVLAVNLTGPMLCSRHAVPHLRQTRGSIVNIASTRALMSEPNTEAYSASKGGLLALTHALALSLAPEVRVNAVSPGWIASDAEWGELSEADHKQHPVGRVGKPQDIAALVAFLASEQPGFISGQNYLADGGMTRKMIYEP